MSASAGWISSSTTKKPTTPSSFSSSLLVGGVRSSPETSLLFSTTTRDEEKKDDDDESSKKKQRLRLLVLDKDGTLGDCNASLRVWATSMTTKLRELLLLENHIQHEVDSIIQEYHDALGWNTIQQTVVPSAPLAAGTWHDQVVLTSQFIQKYTTTKSSEHSALQLAQSWHNHIGMVHSNDPPVIPNLRQVLQECRRRNYILAICTSDDRASTNAALQYWNIQDLIQYSICGDEVPYNECKPSPVPLQLLCRMANVEITSSNCVVVVVGDTTADTRMAQNAGVSHCVGVLTGSGTTQQLLENGAHYILPDVGHLPTLLQELEHHERQAEDELEVACCDETTIPLTVVENSTRRNIKVSSS